MRMLRVVLLLGAAGAAPLAAQAGAADSLRGRVTAALATQVEALADSLSHQGLPGRTLLHKALEGSTKGVPDDRILVAVRTVAGQLVQSAGALRSAGAATDSETVEAGAYAINAGLRGEDVAQVARVSRPPQQAAGSLRSAGTLVAMGVPPREAVSLIRQWIETGHSAREVLELPAQVQAAMAPGLSASQAAAGVAKGRPPAKSHPTGPPPGRPAPPKPEHPKRP